MILFIRDTVKIRFSFFHHLVLPIAFKAGKIPFMLNILFLGEIVGRCGGNVLKAGLEKIKADYNVDYTVVNGEGMTNGYGIGKAHSMQLGKSGVDLVTGGEKLFYKIDMVEFLNHASFILRPLNYPPLCPGKSVKNVVVKNTQLLIINVLGNSSMKVAVQNAFVAIDGFLKKVEGNPVILVVYHAATTAEKATMWHFLDGRVQAVICTHTKVLTSDAAVSEKGTAFISDNGRVGSFMSVGGFDSGTEIRKYRFQIPLRSREAWLDPRIQGVVVTIDEETHRAVKITVVDEKVSVEKPLDRNAQ